MKTWINDFKKFLKRGNVLDLAVAVVIGAAFGRIVTSFVKDILTPILSLIIGESGFNNYKYVITPADESLGIAENAINYGTFFQNIFDFFVVALIIFLIIHAFNKAYERANKRRIAEEKRIQQIKEQEKKATPKQPTIEDLLTDIKKLLENKV
jgi:large conductance mechanosensitive channel